MRRLMNNGDGTENQGVADFEEPDFGHVRNSQLFRLARNASDMQIGKG